MNQNDAFHVWATLGEEGKAPTDLAEAAQSLGSYTVGFAPWLDRLAERYLDGLSRRSAHFKLALAPYGGGKTHFLLAVGLRAHQENFAVSYVPCGADISLDEPLDVYREAVKRLQLPNRGRPGLRALLKAVVETKRDQIRNHGAPDPDAALRGWIHTIRRELYPENAFGRVMATAIESTWLDEPSALGEAAERWLQGDVRTLTREELTELRLAKPTRADNTRLGRDLLLSLIKFLPEAGLVGLTLLIDEVEQLFSQGRSRKAKNKLLAAMRILIDAPGGVPGGLPLFCVFSATPDVLEDFRDYPALEQRLAVRGATFAEGNDFAAQLPLEAVQAQDDLLAGIGVRLIDVGSTATGFRFDLDLQGRNARRLAQVASRRSLEVDARRLFVKSWVGLLDLQTRDGEREFAEEELATRYAGTFDELRQAEDEGHEP